VRFDYFTNPERFTPIANLTDNSISIFVFDCGFEPYPKKRLIINDEYGIYISQLFPPRMLSNKARSGSVSGLYKPKWKAFSAPGSTSENEEKCGPPKGAS